MDTKSHPLQTRYPDPQVHKAIQLDKSHSFLLLFSHGLCEPLSDVTERNFVNIKLAQMIADEFKTQTSLNAVFQVVSDTVCQKHQDYCSSVQL